ncbi:TniB family NTP-binding protein [Geodermatophilus sp. SYSU D00703]
MAVPDSLNSWRGFVAYSPTAPDRMTPRELTGLSDEAKARYDEDRFRWLGSDLVLETEDIVTLQRQTEIAFARSVARSATARRGLAVTGPAGLGKSTAVLLIGKRHERKARLQAGRTGDAAFAPVVYTVVPPGTTPKMMMLAFGNWLGLRTLRRATAQELAEQVVAVLRDLRTSLVIVDEVHNLMTNRSAGAEAASALKTFSERLDATFLYAGIDLVHSPLFTGDMGKQTKARMIVKEMRPFGFGTQAQRDAWTELVLGVEELLPLVRHAEGALEGEATYLYDRTGGSIGALRALLSDAAIAAILEGSERVDRKLLDTIMTDRASTEHGAMASRSPRPAALKRAQ